MVILYVGKVTMKKFECGHIQFANISTLLAGKASVSIGFCAFFRFLTSSILVPHFQTAKDAQNPQKRLQCRLQQYRRVKMKIMEGKITE